MKTNELYQTVLTKLGHIKDNEEKLSEIYILLEEMAEGETDEEIVAANINNPSEYRSLVMQIADAVNDGYVCFLNPETLELEQIECHTWFDAEEIGEQNEDMWDEFGLDYIKWDNYIRFEPFQRDDIRRTMEMFAEDIDDPELSRKLTDGLEANKPLRKLLPIIRHAGKEDVWNVFKKQEIINYVKGELADTELPE